MAGVTGYSRAGRSSVVSQQADYNGDSPRKRTRYNGGEDDGDLSTGDEDTVRLTVRRSRPPLQRANPSTISRSRRVAPADTPRYDSAAAAAAAATGQVDGYKPREERGWEEFHPDLDIEGALQPFTADDVDGIVRATLQRELLESMSPNFPSAVNGISGVAASNAPNAYVEPAPITPPKRRGRPPRKPESMLHGLGSPPGPRITPIPAQNPRERLNLPKPSFRPVETFKPFEDERENSVNYVDKSMAKVGYQESEVYLRADKGFVRLMQDSREEDRDLGVPLAADGSLDEKPSAPSVTRVEYDMDEQDKRWLEAHNTLRKTEQVEAIRPAIFEITMTQIEKEWHALEKRIPKPNPKPPQTHRPRSSSAAAVNGEPTGAGEEQDSKCSICDEGDCENSNAIVFCDGCDLAVHQECYGIPFIPEGQWLCRKCQMIGRSTPACLFCPNTEGAFKMTHEQRWAHLLCAIWIKEVSLGNTTFMEPIMDVASVPSSRWKLGCYICNQSMGASIQCQHTSCYRAYHVTCARRAKLYLQMKVPGGSLALDSGSQVSYCDKHVPPGWRKEHDTEKALRVAQRFYKRTLKDRRWANSQQSALALLPHNISQNGELAEEVGVPEDAQGAAAAKKKQLQAQKNIWRLPSGAPIVPQIVFDAVEMALTRFALRRRKEFVAEACKYWSLKREARRGAALLKRLQLQMETFSASEITRRDFSAMGALGRSRLHRRIELANQLLEQMTVIQVLCRDVRKREELKLQDGETLKQVLDTVYFPIGPLLEPIVHKAQVHVSTGLFAQGLAKAQANIDARNYTSVAAFSADLASFFRSVPGLENTHSLTDAHQRLSDAPLRDESLNSDQKELKKLAKRVIKAVQPSLTDALRREAELNGRAIQKETSDLYKNMSGTWQTEHTVGEQTNFDEEAQRTDAGNEIDYQAPEVPGTNSYKHGNGRLTPNGSMTPKSRSKFPSQDKDGEPDGTTLVSSTTQTILPTPTPSDQEVLTALVQGGVPWYLEMFDPHGTELRDERWSGREVLKGMSEELSEIDDEELNGLGPESKEDEEEGTEAVAEEVTPRAKKSLAKTKRRSTRNMR